MIARKKIITLLCICLSLTACITTIPTPLERINSIRRALLPQVNQQIRAANLEPGAQAYIRIFKEEAILETWLRDNHTGRYRLYKTFPICTYSGLLGPKLREGDHQSPEGFYDVTEDWLWPQSKYHLAMNIGFPNEYDQARGRTGSYLMVHGGCESVGCYAMTDEGIEEIYLLVEQSLRKNNAAVPIHIYPFRMTEENLAKYPDTDWTDFWSSLKPAYDAFEQSKVPPQIFVQNGEYVVRPQIFVRRYGG